MISQRTQLVALVYSRKPETEEEDDHPPLLLTDLDGLHHECGKENNTYVGRNVQCADCDLH